MKKRHTKKKKGKPTNKPCPDYLIIDKYKLDNKEKLGKLNKELNNFFKRTEQNCRKMFGRYLEKGDSFVLDKEIELPEIKITEE